MTEVTTSGCVVTMGQCGVRFQFGGDFWVDATSVKGSLTGPHQGSWTVAFHCKGYSAKGDATLTASSRP